MTHAISRTFRALVGCVRSHRGLRSIAVVAFLSLLVVGGGAFRLASLRSLVFGSGGSEVEESPRSPGPRTAIKAHVGRVVPLAEAERAAPRRSPSGPTATSARPIERRAHEIIERGATPRRC